MAFVRAVYLASFVIEKENCSRKNFVEETLSKAKDLKEICFREEIPKQKFLMISFFRSFTTHTVFIVSSQKIHVQHGFRRFPPR